MTIGILGTEKFGLFQLYLAMRAVADLVYEYASPDIHRGYHMMPWLEDRRNQGVNPYYSQTESGLFLELYYGQPGSIWTPWGKWGCWGGGSGNWREIMPEILERLGAQVFQEKKVVSMGEIGPIYAITKINDLVLPDARPRTAGFVPYKKADEEWDRLTQYYHGIKGTQLPLSITEKFALDRLIRETRGKHEPIRTDADIRDLAGLLPFLGRPVKYTQDGGQTWEYALLWNSPPEEFDNGSHGFAMDCEVTPGSGVHSRGSFTNRDFKRGLLVRPATDEEVKGIRFSYDRTWKKSA